MRNYNYKYKEGVQQGNGIINANSPSDAAYRIARMLGYQGKQTFQGSTYNYISECIDFNNNVPLCIAIKLADTTSSKIRYFSVSQ